MRGSSDILGALLQSGLGGGVGQRRLDSSMQQQGGLGGLLGSMLGQGGGAASAAGGGQGGLGGLLGSVLGGAGGAAAGSGGALGGFLGQARDAVQRNPGIASGGIGALAGALLGGRGSMGGAMGGAALGVLGMVVMNALRGAQGGSASPGLAEAGQPPPTPVTEQDPEAEAGLMLQAMIDAAKADGQIDQGELDAILTKLDEAGIGAEGRRWVLDQLRQPPNMTPLLAVAGDAEMAAKVYAASLLAIKVDTAAERGYLEKLAKGLRLDPSIVTSLHEQLGVEDTPPVAATAPLRSPWRT